MAVQGRYFSAERRARPGAGRVFLSNAVRRTAKDKRGVIMAYENLCMYCFEDMAGESVCPHCGRDSRAAVPQVQMLPGSLVYNDRFLIGRALGQDATGIVYSAFDTKRENKLRLREYLPRDCAERLNDGSVVPVAGLEDQFDAGLKKLRASVESVEDPRKRHFFFEENGTAYIAQRKNAAAAAAPAGRRSSRHDDMEESGGGLRRILIIAAVAVAVVLIAAIVIISMVNGAVNTNKDVTQLPTLNPDQVWVPAQTPTPTPYVTPTFAALVDPDLSWMDYTYDGDVEEDYKKQEAQASTPKPDEDTSKYSTISSKSSSSEIKKFQKQLVTLGWLEYTGVTGKYDSATKQAVKDFQKYINDAYDPDKKLTVDGIAGPKTLQWLEATQAVRPTATPTPVVTPDPEEELTVDEDSSAKDIIAVQRKLIYLGVMPEGSDDGVYGASTVKAVKQFQKRVNKLQGYEVLEVTGKVDPLTMSFLNYYVEKWEEEKPETENTPTPTPTPTPAPEGETMNAINASSPKESIKYVQQMLIAVGLLPEGSADGVYGSNTISAVAYFQEWVNQQKKDNVLDVTGEADQLTLAYLEYCEGNNMYPKGTPKPTEAPTDEPTEKPTEAPTEEPTEEPTEAPTQAPEEEPDEGKALVTPDSPKESIQFVQSMLHKIGFLDADDVDGVYGKGTKNAVSRFQQWVNEQRGKDDLEVTGLCDELTLNWMEYCVDNGLSYKEETQPTEKPTEKPTEAPEEAPETGKIGEISVAVNGKEAGYDLVTVSEGNVKFSWSCEGDVDSYYVYVEDASGNSVLQGEGVSNTAFEVHSSRMNPGEVYTLTVGALPVNGSEEDISWKQVLFMLPEAEEEPTEEPTKEPEEEPTPKPTEEPEDEPEQEPEKGTVTEVSISIGGVSAGSSPIIMDADSFQITWNGGDEVAAYSYQIKDEDGNVVVEKQNTDQTGITAKASAMEPAWSIPSLSAHCPSTAPRTISSGTAPSSCSRKRPPKPPRRNPPPNRRPNPPRPLRSPWSASPASLWTGPPTRRTASPI